MALLATLHDHRRAAERQALDADATLRIDGRPLDALIANISMSGCLFVCSERLDVGDTVTIGIAGIGRRRVQIVRALGARYGAEFEVPLDQVEIDAAVAEPGEVVVSFPMPIAEPSVGEEEPSRAGKLLPPVRLVVVVGLAVLSWWVLIAALRAASLA